MNKSALKKIVSEEAMGWRRLARTDKDLEALQRLVDHPAAQNAWERLALKLGGDDLRMAISLIARDAVNAHLGHCDEKTKKEIQDAAMDAARLAERLAVLIESNRTLQMAREEDILDPLEVASLARLRGGLLSVAVLSKSTEQWFGPEIENELDVMQAVNFPDLQHLKTSDAYRVFSGRQALGAFVLHLKNFAKFARKSKQFQPVVPKPKGKNAALQACSLSVCGALEHVCGSPNDDIAADLVSAVFNTIVDPGLVKKWRQRQGDKT